MMVTKQVIPSGKPSETKDFYERLGVSQTASEQELKTAYRTLAQQWHPDHNPGKEKEYAPEFVAVCEAYTQVSSEGRKVLEDLPKTDDSFMNYREFFDIINHVSPEMSTVLRMFSGSSMPLGLEALFRDFYGK